MADAPKKSSKTTPKGKIVLYSVLGLGGIALAYWLYTKYEANAAAGTTSGTPTTTTDTGTGTVAGSPSASSAPPITDINSWKQAIIAYMVSNGIKGGENVAATAVADALSGHCLGPNEFSGLNNALGSVGQPPGTGTLVLSACKPKAANPSATSTHTPSETPKKPTATTKAHTPANAAATKRTNAIDAARRRANNIAAAARRRANQAAAGKPKVPKVIPPQVKRAGVR